MSEFNLKKARNTHKNAPSDLEGRLWMGDELCAVVDALSDACDEIERLQNALIEERASKKISLFCNCEKCWPLGSPKPESRVKAEEKARQEARDSLHKEGVL